MQRAEKPLIYNPDAVGMWLWQKYTEWFAPCCGTYSSPCRSARYCPLVTPVCFGTMYTGVEPIKHGIQKYEKHVLAQESLFDCLA